MAGVKPGRAAHRFGVRLATPFFDHLCRISLPEAKELEGVVARQLELAGLVVHCDKLRRP